MWMSIINANVDADFNTNPNLNANPNPKPDPIPNTDPNTTHIICRPSPQYLSTFYTFDIRICTSAFYQRHQAK